MISGQHPAVKTKGAQKEDTGGGGMNTLAPSWIAGATATASPFLYAGKILKSSDIEDERKQMYT